LKHIKVILFSAGVAALYFSSRSTSKVNTDLKTYSAGAPSNGGGLSATVSIGTDSRISASPQSASPDSFNLNFMGA